MQRVVLFCLLAVAVASPLKSDPEAVSDTASGALSETEYPDSIKDMLHEALADRPKKARQIFQTGSYIGTKRRLRKDQAKERSEDGVKEADSSTAEDKQKDGKAKAAIGQEVGWRPSGALRMRALQRSRSLAKSDDKETDVSTDASEKSDDSVAEGEDLEEEEDREAENSYLNPYFAPAPGGLGGYGGYGGGYGGYGGAGPYIYILPIVLPPPGRHHGPAGRHVVTETGHESHHYSGGHAVLPSGGHGQYQPVYAGSQGVPPIYIPKGYGHPNFGGHGGHGGHTTVHHEEAAIIRDIDPPIFKA